MTVRFTTSMGIYKIYTKIRTKAITKLMTQLHVGIVKYKKS